MKEIYSKTTIPKILRRAVRINPKYTNSSHYNRIRKKIKGPTVWLIRQKYGTWANALKSAGIKRCTQLRCKCGNLFDRTSKKDGGLIHNKKHCSNRCQKNALYRQNAKNYSLSARLGRIRRGIVRSMPMALKGEDNYGVCCRAEHDFYRWRKKWIKHSYKNEYRNVSVLDYVDKEFGNIACSGSSLIQRGKREGWSFSCKQLIRRDIDYLFCVGFDHSGFTPIARFLIPYHKINGKVAINIYEPRLKKGIYNHYEINNSDVIHCRR